MNQRVCLLIAICLSTFSYAQQVNFDWAISFGAGNFIDAGESIAVDGSGDVYIIGAFRGTIDFDPGPGSNNLTSQGSADVFVQKLDPSGNLVWAKSFGGALFDYGYSITVDGSGNVYTTGSFQGTVDFDPGPGLATLTSAGSDDVFIQKLDPLGNLIWAKSFGNTSNDRGESITVDGSGNVYTTGFFQGTADFDPGAGTNFLTSQGYEDVFVQKLDPLGNLIWTKSFGSSFGDFVESIAVDSFGNVFTTGSFLTTADFDPGPGIFNLTPSSGFVEDVFIQKLDANGSFLWAKAFGGTSNDQGYSLAVDASGNVYTTGYFAGTVDFDPGAGTFNLSSRLGGRDVFIEKLDANGNFLWAKAFGGSDGDRGLSIAVDTAGNIYTTGYFRSFVDFDPGIGTTFLSSVGRTDVFIQKLDANGDFLWVQTFGDIQNDQGNSIVVDVFGNIYTTGYFIGPADFDPGIDTFYLTASMNSSDGFVQKLNQCAANTGTDVITACDSYTWIDGQTYTASNDSATFTLMNAAGCDSLVTLDLTINNSTTGIDVITACDSYAWIDGNTYTASNSTATFTLTNVAGCDSVVTLDLTINNSTTGTDVITACGSYTWVDGTTYTSSNNTAMFTLTNAAGCDSVVTLDLTINSVSDITTSLIGVTITATNSNATYQWLDCDNGFAPISGETNQAFMATANGNYAVELTENGCIDTSACVSITTVGITENSFGDAFAVYPNPTSGNFRINLGAFYDHAEVRITDVLGSIIQTKSIPETQQIDLSITSPSGLYIVTVDAGEKRAIIRVVKE